MSSVISTRRTFLAGFGALAAAGLPAWSGAGSVEFGVCTDSAHFPDTVRYGFDYCEPEVAEIAAMEESRFQAFAEHVRAAPIRCTAFRSFIRTLRVVGDDVRRDALRAYLELSLARCRSLGAEVIVWGSSGSRNVPDGFSRDRAWDQIQEFLRLAGDFARPHGIVIAVEPLRRQESNILNTGAEALRLVREVHHPQVKMIIDFFHLRQENEDPGILREAQEEIVHLHFANPAGRRWPRSPSEDPQYRTFFDLVKKIGFRGGLSIEGSGTFDNDAAASLRFFQEMLA